MISRASHSGLRQPLQAPQISDSRIDRVALWAPPHGGDMSDSSMDCFSPLQQRQRPLRPAGPWQDVGVQQDPYLWWQSWMQWCQLILTPAATSTTLASSSSCTFSGTLASGRALPSPSCPNCGAQQRHW